MADYMLTIGNWEMYTDRATALAAHEYLIANGVECYVFRDSDPNGFGAWLLVT